MPNDTGVIEQGAGQSNRVIEVEINPSFPETERQKLTTTLQTYGEISSSAGLTNPIKNLKINVFPEEQVEEMNSYILRIKGIKGDLGRKRESGKAVGQYIKSKEGTSAEIFLVYGEETTLPPGVNEVLGHELAHLIQGENRDYDTTGEVVDLMRKPIGTSDEVFVLFKQKIVSEGFKTICFFNKGLERFVECEDRKGIKYYFLVRGHLLNEMVTDWIGGYISNSSGMAEITQRLSQLVGEEQLLGAFVSGSSEYLEKIFERKTGRPFQGFVDILDEAEDFVEIGLYSGDAITQFKKMEEQALEML